MATTKKSAAKKPIKKMVKKPVAKKTTVKRVSAKKPVSVAANFWKIEFTINTVYWLVIGVAVIATAFIAVDNNQRLNAIYDQIDAENARIDTL